MRAMNIGARSFDSKVYQTVANHRRHQEARACGPGREWHEQQRRHPTEEVEVDAEKRRRRLGNRVPQLEMQAIVRFERIDALAQARCSPVVEAEPVLLRVLELARV